MPAKHAACTLREAAASCRTSFCTPACSLLQGLQAALAGQVRIATFVCVLTGAGSVGSAALSYLWDHQVSGRPVFPGAGYFEMAGSAATVLAASSSGPVATGVALADISIVAPLLLPLPAAGSDVLMLQASYSVADGTLSILSTQKHSRRSRPTVHVEGTATKTGQRVSKSRAAVPVVRQQRQRRGAGCRLLATLVYRCKAAAFAELEEPRHDATAVTVSPAVLDCCLQLAAVPDGSATLRIPAGVGLLVLGSTPAVAGNDERFRFLALSRPSVDGLVQDDSEATFTDYYLAGLCSQACIQDMEARPMGSTAPSRKIEPRRLAAGATNSLSGTKLAQDEWLYVLELLAHANVGSTAAPGAGEAMHLGSLQLCATVQHASTAAAAIAIGQQAVAGGLQSVQLLTHGALSITAPGSGAPPAGSTPSAALWAFARTMALELTSFGVQATDLQRQTPAGRHTGAATAFVIDAASKAAPLFANLDELHCSPYGHAVQGGCLVAASLCRSPVKPFLSAFCLFPQPRGALQNLAPLPMDGSAASVAPGQVLVAVKAVGINFRDVLNVLGMYPGDPGPPGGDCAGVVVASGPGVSHLRPGDAVFGLAGGSLGSHVHVSSQTVTHVSVAPASQFCSGIGTGCGLRHVPCLNALQMPANLDFEAAATTPTVCITVDSAFRQSTVVRPGDRVLVHAAAGGVGIAAMQLIAALGGSTVATAGSSSKRALVRSLGPSQVHGSRDTLFVSELAEVGGASVALNSLTSSGMVAGSLAALDVGGRFVEISKRDIWSAARVAQGAGTSCWVAVHLFACWCWL